VYVEAILPAEPEGLNNIEFFECDNGLANRVLSLSVQPTDTHQFMASFQRWLAMLTQNIDLRRCPCPQPFQPDTITGTTALRSAHAYQDTLTAMETCAPEYAQLPQDTWHVVSQAPVMPTANMRFSDWQQLADWLHDYRPTHMSEVRRVLAHMPPNGYYNLDCYSDRSLRELGIYTEDGLLMLEETVVGFAGPRSSKVRNGVTARWQQMSFENAEISARLPTPENRIWDKDAALAHYIQYLTAKAARADALFVKRTNSWKQNWERKEGS
jgi:hypothetical protein